MLDVPSRWLGRQRHSGYQKSTAIRIREIGIFRYEDWRESVKNLNDFVSEPFGFGPGGARAAVNLKKLTACRMAAVTVSNKVIKESSEGCYSVGGWEPRRKFWSMRSRRKRMLGVGWLLSVVMGLSVSLPLSAQAPAPSINAGGVVNNASYTLAGTAAAPGTIAAIFGTNLTDGTSCVPPSCFPSFEGGRLRTTMAGASVTINGIPAPLFYATPNQIGVQIPTELSGASASMQVTVGGQSSTAQTISLEPFSPGIFTFSQDGRGGGAITHASGTPVNPQNPALPNEVVIIYATGLGQVTPAVPTGALPSGLTQTLTNPTVTVDGISAEVQFSGLSGCCVGLNQINVKIPSNTRSGNDIPIVLTIGGKQSNPVTVAIASQQAAGPGSGEICSLAIDPINPDIIYATTNQNAGRTAGRAVFKSTNGGASWTTVSVDTASFAGCINDLTIDPTNPSVLYGVGRVAGAFSDFFGVIKSTNGGATWFISLQGYISHLVIDPRNPAVLYASQGGGRTSEAPMIGGVFKSTNGAQSWRPSGLANIYVYSLAIDPISPTTVYAGTQRGVFKSDDAGASWIAASAGLPPPEGTERDLLYGTDITALAIDPTNPSTLYAGTRSRGIFKSADGGQSWVSANSGVTGVGTWAIVIDPTNSATLYAATGAVGIVSGGGVFKSTNAAGSWTEANSGLTELVIYALVIDPRNPATLYAGTARRGVFKSTNGGQSWQPAGR